LSLSGESCIPLSGDCQIFPYFLYGVERFCHSGDTLDLYRAYRIDAEAILDAAVMAIVEERKAG